MYISIIEKLLKKSKIGLKKHFVSLPHTPNRKVKLFVGRMSAGDRGKHFVSQRHVSGKYNASFRGKGKKKEERKKNEPKEPNKGCGFPGKGGGNQPHLSRGQLQHPWENNSQGSALFLWWFDSWGQSQSRNSPTLSGSTAQVLQQCLLLPVPKTSSLFILLPEYCCGICGGLQGEGDWGIWYCSEPGGCRNPTEGLGGGEESRVKVAVGGTRLLANSCCFPGLPCGKQRQLPAIPRPICHAISKITHQFKVNYIYLYLIIFQLGSC